MDLKIQDAKTTRPTVYKKNYDYNTLWGYFDHEIKWINLFFLLFVHLYVPIGIFSLDFPLFCWGLLTGFIGGFGVTAGAHRFFTHKCFKATTFLKVLLMLAYSSAGHNPLFEWVRDHRVHHKYSETDADPHNSKRGFFFAHCGWLMMKKHPDVISKGKSVDCSDILEDPVVQFHQKYYIILMLSLCFFLPTVVPVYFFGYSWRVSFECCVLKWLTLLHCTWLVNSAAHLWGNRPYNKDIQPVETKIVSFFALGEGWHNYHHTFPWDYKASEFSYYINITTFWIDVFAALGWAYDLKQPSKELVKRTVEKLGDGSHFECPLEIMAKESDEYFNQFSTKNKYM